MSALLDVHDFVAQKLAWHFRVLCDADLGNRAKTVASLLLHDLNAAHGGAAWRAQDEMAARAGFSVRTLQLGLDELEAGGHLRIDRAKGRGRSNRYFALMKAEEPAAAIAADAEEKAQPSASNDAEEKAQPSASQLCFDAKEHVEKDAAECIEDPLGNPLDSPLTPQRDDDVAFKRFQAAYPRNNALAPTSRKLRWAFRGIVDGGEAAPSALVACAEGYSRERRGQEVRFTLSPERFLREGHWKRYLASATRADGAKFPEARVRAELLALPGGGPAFVGSYLDGQSWDDEGRAIVCRGPTAASRLLERAGRYLRAEGISVVCDPAKHGALLARATVGAV